MDIKVTLRQLLSREKDLFTLIGPCVCCGKPSEDVWTYNKKYNLESWVASSGGKTGNVTPVKQGYKDKEGNSAQGEIELNLPYCPEHFDQSKRLQNYHSKQQNGMIVAGIVAVILYFVLFGWNWVGDAETNIQVGTRLCVVPILVFAGIAGLGIFAFTSLNESKVTKPEFVDYPINSTDGGGSGLAIKVAGDEVGRIGENVKYYLNLDFKDVDAAKQFKQKYPGAVIIKGREYLE